MTGGHPLPHGWQSAGRSQCPVSDSLAQTMCMTRRRGRFDRRNRTPDRCGTRDLARHPQTPCSPPRRGDAGARGDPARCGKGNSSSVESGPMSRLRSIFAWLLMAAVPMQGFAAASMLYCGASDARHGFGQVRQVVAPDPLRAPAASASPAHDRAAHTHAQSGHGALEHATSAPVVHDQGTGAGPGVATGQTSPDAGHQCSVCAACCNGVAIFEVPHVVAMAPGPQAEPAEPFVRIHARATPVPDKPPRA